MKIAKWHGRAVHAAAMRHLRAGLDDGAEFLMQMLRKEISVPGPPRSRPWQSPHIDTSELIEAYEIVDRSSVAVEVTNTSMHAIWMERGVGGSRPVAPRPWTEKTIIRYQNKIARLICKKM